MPGTGASGAISPSARSSAHRSAGIGWPHERRVVVEMVDRADAGDERGDRRMGERELDRRGSQRDAVPRADRRQPPGAVDDVGRRRPVVEPAPGRGSARMPLFITPPIRTAIAALDAERQQRRQGAPGRAACSGRRAGTTSMSASRANRASIADWFMPGADARTTPSARSRASAGYAPPIAACQWSSGSWISAMSIRSRPSRSRLSSSDRRTPSAL